MVENYYLRASIAVRDSVRLLIRFECAMRFFSRTPTSYVEWLFKAKTRNTRKRKRQSAERIPLRYTLRSGALKALRCRLSDRALLSCECACVFLRGPKTCVRGHILLFFTRSIPLGKVFRATCVPSERPGRGGRSGIVSRGGGAGNLVNGISLYDMRTCCTACAC